MTVLVYVRGRHSRQQYILAKPVCAVEGCVCDNPVSIHFIQFC